MFVIEVIDNARALINEPLESTRVFPDNTSSFWGDTTLLSYLNLIQQEVAAEVGQVFEDYFVTQAFLGIVNGTAEYTLPTTFVKMRRLEDVRGGASAEIYPITMNQRGTVIGDAINSAIMPGNSYYIRGNQVVFTDTPTFTDSAAIRLQYVTALADLTGSTSISELPREHHRVLVWGLVKLCHFSQQANDPMIQFANQEFEKHLIKIKQQCENRQIQRPRRVCSNTNIGDM